MLSRASTKPGKCPGSPGAGKGGETFLHPAACQRAERGTGSSPLPIAALPADPGLIALHFAASFSSLQKLRKMLINTHTASAMCWDDLREKTIKEAELEDKQKEQQDASWLLIIYWRW